MRKFDRGAALTDDAERLTTVYRELRAVARRLLDREGRAHTLESVELVNQAFAKVLGGELREAAIADPSRYVALLVLDMQRELVDHARRRRAAKRPDPKRQIALDDAVILATHDPDGLLEVERLLDALAGLDTVRNGAQKAQVARYALYAGLTEAEIAAATGLPKSTVGNELRFVRAWLMARLAGE